MEKDKLDKYLDFLKSGQLEGLSLQEGNAQVKKILIGILEYLMNK